MREIKFRAWDKKNKVIRDVWSINWSYEGKNLKAITVATNQVINEEYLLREGEFELIGFTGLKDKNGIEIYDGDVVEIIHPCWHEKATTEFVNGSFIFKQVNGEEKSCIPGWTFMREKWELKVIGNIYENPELL